MATNLEIIKSIISQAEDLRLLFGDVSPAPQEVNDQLQKLDSYLDDLLRWGEENWRVE